MSFLESFFLGGGGYYYLTRGLPSLTPNNLDPALKRLGRSIEII